MISPGPNSSVFVIASREYGDNGDNGKIFVELMSTEVCGIADGNQMRIKMCVVFLLI